MVTSQDISTRGVQAKDKSVRELLSNVQYSIDFYQRDYKWESKQVFELISDLTERFLDSYRPVHVRSEVATYPSYYLGSIVLSKKIDGLFIVDGQQRLTTLTLLLIYLRNQQSTQGDVEDPNLQALIQSTQFGKKNFNIDVVDRRSVVELLYAGHEPPLDVEETLLGVSATNMLERYSDIEECFPEECKGSAISFFADWLIERVQMVEIIAFSDEDAYTVFETMNDRGLTLSPSDMLKGYLLSNIKDLAVRNNGEGVWKSSVSTLKSSSAKDAKNDFFRTWFRGQYAQTVGHPVNTDYERLGPEFHRWLRINADSIGIKHSDHFADFVIKKLPVFSRVYSSVNNAQTVFNPEISKDELIYYVSQARIDDGLLYMSVIDPNDNKETSDSKIRVVARYLDILIYRRTWAGKNLTKSGLKNSFIPLAKELRGLSLEDLTVRLFAELTKAGHDNFETSPPVLTNTYRRRIHRLLARLITYVETSTIEQNPYAKLVARSGRSRYDIEHIWPDKFEEYKHLFLDKGDFDNYRNRLGSLVIIPSYLNQSYNAMPTQDKIKLYGRSDHYSLVASLASSSYIKNTKFTKWVEASGLHFVHYDGSERSFDKSASDQRLELYRSLAKRIWSAENLVNDSGLDFNEIVAKANDVRATLRSDIDATSRRFRTQSNVKIIDLILAGLIQPGDVLIGKELGTTSQATAIVLEDGNLELENGERFSSPSAAAMNLGLDKSINGWKFWIHDTTKMSLRDLRKRVSKSDESESDVEFEDESLF